MARAHQDETSLPAPNQFKAAQDESAHENFAEFGVARDERAQAFAAEFKEVARLSDAAKDETAATGDHGHFAGESAGIVRGDKMIAIDIGLNDFHFSGKDDEEGNVGIVGLKENFARFDVPHLAQRADAIDLRRRENRKYLGARVERAGYWNSGHIASLRGRPRELEHEEVL
jgi:hypothetical protein